MEHLGVHHISINVRDLEAALEFYARVLGLGVLERPDLGFPGAWLGLADGRQLHLVESPESVPAAGQHFAFEVRDIEKVHDALRARGVRVSKILDLPSGGRQCFFRDPSENLLELNQPNP